MELCCLGSSITIKYSLTWLAFVKGEMSVGSNFLVDLIGAYMYVAAHVESLKYTYIIKPPALWGTSYLFLPTTYVSVCMYIPLKNVPCSS